MSDWNEFEGNSQGQYNGDAYSQGQQSGNAYSQGQQSGDAYSQGQQGGDAYSQGQYNGDAYYGGQFNGGQTYFDPNAMPNQQGMPPQKQGNGMAVASLVLGIIGIVACCCSWIFGAVLGILAIVFGVKGRQQDPGNSMATAGMVLGVISLILAAVNVVVAFVISFVYGITEQDLLNEFYYYY
ncbi:MAG: DUF4190 domain-containing protein [Clostridiales bacterium]|nr:DUF4190 domain-containing protein [Clostridiales bacterium]